MTQFSEQTRKCFPPIRFALHEIDFALDQGDNVSGCGGNDREAADKTGVDRFEPRAFLGI